MEELSALKKMGKRELLNKVCIYLFILSGTILDIVNSAKPIELNTFLDAQAMCREFMILGAFLFAYSHIPFRKVKDKSFAFMFCILYSIIIIHNNIFDTPYTTILILFYSVYLLWLIRIFIIHKETNMTIYRQKDKIHTFHHMNKPYNILLPVKTFRGILQVLFIPWKNPIYETRLLVDQSKIIGIIDNKFVAIEYSLEHVINITKDGCKVIPCKNYSKEKIYGLIGKRAILGFRDCKRLEV